LAAAEPAAPPPGLEDDGDRRRMERPRTALRGPPKVQTNTAVKDTRPTSKQDPVRTAKVIGEGAVDSDDDDDKDALLGGGGGAVHQSRPDRSEISAAGHGALVRNMLEMDQGSAEGATTAEEATTADSLSNLNRNKDREKTQQVRGGTPFDAMTLLGLGFRV
jgi:hypothetical protein